MTPDPCYSELTVMPHLPQVSQDLFCSILRAGSLHVHYVTGEILRSSITYRKSPSPPYRRVYLWEEVISTYRCTICRLQVDMHLVLTLVASRVFIVPLPPCDAALTSRMIRDMCKAVDTKFLWTHAVRECSCLGDSPLLYFFLLIVDPITSFS